MSEESSTSDDTGDRTAIRVLQWLPVSALAVTAVTIAAVHAPARIKLIGLFAIACGVAAGWMLGELAGRLNIASSKSVFIGSTLLLLAGQLGMAVESHRLYAAQIRSEFKYDPNALMLDMVLRNDASSGNSKEMEALRELALKHKRRHADLTGFAAYLQHRVAALGNWKSPWPLLFWLAETCLGTIAGVVAATRTARNRGRSALDAAATGR